MKNREVAPIAGASKGIGRFLAEHFVKKGAIVEGCSRKPVDWSLSGYTHHVAGVTNETQVREMSSSLRKRMGGLTLLLTMQVSLH
jgi:3-oxoacyl-[acyl-carrier protein] reductase